MKKIKSGMTRKVLLAITIICYLYILLNMVSAAYTVTSARIETNIPMFTDSKVGLSLDGGLTIIAPNTPGHWETKHGYFTDSKKVQFCPVETVGIRSFTFVPDDGNILPTSVYAIFFVWEVYWEAYTEEIIAIIIVAFIAILLYLRKVSFPKTTLNAT